VEQDHCTLIAVKRYRDPPRIGGRHNFLLSTTSVNNKTIQGHVSKARVTYRSPDRLQKAATWGGTEMNPLTKLALGPSKCKQDYRC